MIKDKALDLIKRHGFLLWLVDQVKLLSAEHTADTNNDLEGCEKICEELVQIFCESWNSSKHIFKKENVGCFNWGLVAGKSQTHFGWSTILELQKRKENGEFLNANDEIPEPKEWFHDIFRVDGTPYDEREIEFIKKTVLG